MLFIALIFSYSSVVRCLLWLYHEGLSLIDDTVIFLCKANMLADDQVLIFLKELKYRQVLLHWYEITDTLWHIKMHSQIHISKYIHIHMYIWLCTRMRTVTYFISLCETTSSILQFYEWHPMTETCSCASGYLST